MMKKLSELPTEKGFDVLCNIIPFVNNIATDEELSNCLSAAAKIDKTSIKSKAQLLIFGAERINEFAPILLKNHRTDVYGILAELADVDIETLKNQPLLSTIKQIKYVMSDDDLIGLFMSQGQKGDATSSGSASGTTEAP